jgi:hypothetical protein
MQLIINLPTNVNHTREMLNEIVMSARSVSENEANLSPSAPSRSRPRRAQLVNKLLIERDVYMMRN